MKKYYWLAGVTILTIGFGIFLHKTKKIVIEWDLEDKDFGEDLCQNCRG